MTKELRSEIMTEMCNIPVGGSAEICGVPTRRIYLGAWQVGPSGPLTPDETVQTLVESCLGIQIEA